MRPITTTLPAPDFRTLVLPDDQRFQASSLAHIDIATATLSIWLTGVATAVSYTAASDILAWFLMIDIFKAASSATGSETQISIRGQAGVSISSLSPDPLAAAGGETATLTGIGFSLVDTPVVNVSIGGSGGITYYPCTNVVVNSDISMSFLTPVLAVAAAANVILSSVDQNNISAIMATSIV